MGGLGFLFDFWNFISFAKTTMGKHVNERVHPVRRSTIATAAEPMVASRRNKTLFSCRHPTKPPLLSPFCSVQSLQRKYCVD